MGQKIEDKSKIGNWIEGDTFAIKIENCEYEEYNGRYLILIRTPSNWEKSRTILSFRAKITQDDKIPKTIEELEKLDYIIAGYTPYETRFCPFEYQIPINETIEKRSKIPMYPDEYGYLYHYLIDLYIKKFYVPENVKYIGNFLVLSPKEEYVPFFGNRVKLLTWDRIHNLINTFKRFNLKEGDCYTDEVCKQIHENGLFDMKVQFEMEKMFFGKTEEEIVEMCHLDPNEKPRDKCTYVGEKKRKTTSSKNIK